MKIEIEIDDIDYDRTLDTVMPLAEKHLNQEGNLLGKVVGFGGTKLAAKGVIKAMPQKKKNEYLADLVNKNSRELARTLENAADDNGIGIRIASIKVRP